MSQIKKWRIASTLLISAICAAAVLFVPLNASAASVTRIPFTGLFYGCSSEEPVVRISGDKILHFRDAVNHNLWVTSTPLLNGFDDNVVNGNINLVTGLGVAHPHEVLRPFAYDGTWEMSVRIKVTPTGLLAEAVGHGTGALQGMTLRWEQTGQIVVGPGENPCGDIPFAPTFAGEILIPA